MSTAEPEEGRLESEIRDDLARVEHRDHPLMRRLHRARAWVAQRPAWNIAYRTGIAILGGVMVIGGLILVPLPGPGWLIVFLGLAVLGTEFHWARRISRRLKGILDRFWAWWHAWRAQRAERKAARRAPQPAVRSLAQARTDRAPAIRPKADAA